MYIKFDSVEDFAERLSVISRQDQEVLMIFLAAAHQEAVPRLVELLNQRDIPFFGALFPKVFSGIERHNDGAIVHTLPLVGAPVIAKMSAETIHWSAELPDLAADDLPAHVRKYTALVFADFMGTNNSSVLRELFEHYANGVNYFGAGVGTGVREPQPVVFCHEGCAGDAAVVAFTPLSSVLSVYHGWQRLHGPIIATRTRKNVIEELDWEPAVNVYQRVLGEHMPKSLASPADLPTAKRFPFGISREDDEDVVRDPLIIDQDSGVLTCLSDIPQNAVLYILQCDSDKLVQAAPVVGKAVGDRLNGQNPNFCLLMDCHSRAILLEDRFTEELELVRQALLGSGIDIVPEGAQALGELASDGERLPVFHNKTIALGAFSA